MGLNNSFPEAFIHLVSPTNALMGNNTQVVFGGRLAVLYRDPRFFFEAQGAILAQRCQSKMPGAALTTHQQKWDK